MPTYDYRCLSCHNVFEHFQSMASKPLNKCPECGKKVERLPGGGLGVIFKGSGFYQTDYKGSSKPKKNTEGEKPAAACSPGSCQQPQVCASTKS